MKSRIKMISKYVMVFIGLLVIFNVLLLLTSLFSSSLIEKNVIQSSEILYKQGNTWKIPITEFTTILVDNYTDALIINSAYSIDNTKPIESYMSLRKNYKSGLTTKIESDTNGELISVNSRLYNPVR